MPVSPFDCEKAAAVANSSMHTDYGGVWWGGTCWTFIQSD